MVEGIHSIQRRVRVWNSEKTRGYIMSCTKFDELLTKAKEKFDCAESMKLVLEDGIEIDGDSYNVIEDMSSVFMLKGDESLCLPGCSNSDSRAGASALLDLVKRVSVRGDWDSFHQCLGDFKQTVLQEDEFSVDGYCKQHCLSTRPRVYLMSKEKSQSVNWPKIPVCVICKDRFCDSFFTTSGHTVCYVCAAELEERDHMCHVCRKEFIQIKPLYY